MRFSATALHAILNPVAPETSAQTTTMSLPPKQLLVALQESAAQHNILELRSLLSQLQHANQYPTFAEKLASLVKGYQFKQIQQWLAHLK